MLIVPNKPLIIKRGDVARELRRLGFKLYDDDATRSWILPGIGATPGFHSEAFVSAGPFDLDTGSTSLTIETGATGYEIWVLGGGGGGGKTAAVDGGGGGGGGCSYRTGSILAGEWGASITRSVGAAGTNETSAAAANGVDGGNSTLSATLGGVAVSMTGGGGKKTNNSFGGIGGTATGGTGDVVGFDGTAGGGGGGAPGIDLGGSRGTGGDGESSTQPIGGRIRVKFT